MANWSNPTLTSLYTDFVNEVKNRDVDLALGLDPATTSPTNIPTNAIRWNSANNRWEKYNGSTWNALSTAFSIPLGTQGSPSIYFDTDTNTGLYSPGADQVAISTGGTGRVFVDSAGNVGIGTAPAQKLHVVNTSAGTTTTPLLVMNRGNAASTAAQIALIATGSDFSDGQYAAIKAYSSQGTGNTSHDLGFLTCTTGGTPTDRFRITSNGSVNITGAGTAGSTQAISFSGSAPVDSLVVTSAGRVGLGTSSPIGRLTLGNSTNNFLLNLDGSSSYTEIQSFNAPLYLNRQGNNTILNTGGGSVGVGVANPSNTLDINGTARFRLGGTNQLVVSTDSGNPYLYVEQNAPLNFGTNSQIRATLDASGNLGLGVTPNTWSTTAKAFQFGSYSALYQNASGYPELAFNTYQNTSNIYIYRNTDVATRYSQTNGSHSWFTAPSGTAGNPITFTQAMTLDASGNLLLTTTSAPNGGTARDVVFYNGNSASTYLKLSNLATGTTSADGFDLVMGTNSDAYVYNRENGPIIFGTNNTERARLNNQGYLTGTVNGLSSGIYPSKQYFRLNSARNGANQAAAQSVFGVGVSLVASTVYEFEALYYLQCSSASGSPTMSFLFGGTATINNIMYSGVGPGPTSVLPPASTYDSAPASFIATSAGASVVSGTLISAASVIYFIKGSVSINAAGTFIPQYSFDVAPGNLFTTNAGSYFSIWPLGASGSNTSIGSWA